MTTEEWDRCWRLFGPWVTGEQERVRTIVNQDVPDRYWPLVAEFVTAAR